MRDYRYSEFKYLALDVVEGDENLIIGTITDDGYNTLDFFYSKYEREMYIENTNSVQYAKEVKGNRLLYFIMDQLSIVKDFEKYRSVYLYN